VDDLTIAFLLIKPIYYILLISVAQLWSDLSMEAIQDLPGARI